MKYIARILVTVLACAALPVSTAQAQQSERRPPGGPGGEQQRHPKPPIDLALDTNGDQFIDADEIANASTALATLDTDRNGLLTAGECLPKGPDDGDRPAPPDGAGERPDPPIFTALDVSGDQVIDEREVAGASSSLLELDTNGDGRLGPDECRPSHPGERRGGGNQGR